MKEVYYQIGPLLPPDEEDPVFDYAEEKTPEIDETDLQRLVPITASHLCQNNASLALTQMAHDAFHQEDYVSAIKHYKEVLEISANITEALLGLTASYYFMKEYTLADATLEKIRHPHGYYLYYINQISVLITKHLG